MRAVAPHDRPREKLLRLGPAGLGDNELLAMVIGSGVRDADALAVANGVLARCGGLHRLTRAGLDGLTQVTGIGEARASGREGDTDRRRRPEEDNEPLPGGSGRSGEHRLIGAISQLAKLNPIHTADSNKITDMSAYILANAI